MKKNVERIKKSIIFAAQNNKKVVIMETTHNTTNITIVSLASMDKLDVGDIFLFSTDGPKYVFLLKTLDGRFTYMRCDNERHYSCRRNRQVFVMDLYGGLFIANGELFIDYNAALSCAMKNVVSLYR